MVRRIVIPVLVVLELAALMSLIAGPAPVRGQEAARPHDDLDAFMRLVLARRDENWKKLQQYVLDERESIDLRGPDRTPLWGERRDYTWFIRDGFFVRSPVKVNGVTIGEADRRSSEATFLRREQERERRRNRGPGGTPPRTDGIGEPGSTSPPPSAPGSAGTPAPPADAQTPERSSEVDAPHDMNALLRQTREPQFISSAYFLRFRFEEGRYAFVGREAVEGVDLPEGALRIEYYPTQLFRGTDRRRNGRGASDDDKAYDAEFRRLMNKSSLITLWVTPDHQIVKYTFDNVALDFLPAQWLVHVDDLRASMTMGQPFDRVWLPKALEFQAAMTLATGQFSLHYGLDYHDYRRADVTTKVAIPKGR